MASLTVPAYAAVGVGWYGFLVRLGVARVFTGAEKRLTFTAFAIVALAFTCSFQKAKNMFHLLGNFISIGTVVDTDVTPIQDNVILIQNNHWVFQQDMSLLAATFMETTPARARIVAASLRIPSTPWVRPLITGAIPPNIPVIADYRQSPLLLRGLEETYWLATSALAMGNENATGLMWVGDGITPIPQGNIVTMRGTSTTAAAANKWSAITVTWQDTLPMGVYGIVGLQHQSTNAQACRLIINGQYWRPGSLSVTALGNYGVPYMLKGGFGLWGTFRSTAMPIPEVLCNAADAVHEIYLEFVRMS